MKNNKEGAPPVEKVGANAASNASSNTQSHEAQAREETTASKANARRRTELDDVPTYAELARDGLRIGMSVIIMLNFVDSVYAISEQLRTLNVITGQSNFGYRQYLIKAFNAGEENLIVMTINAGGLDGITLRSKLPRLVIVSPTRSKGGQP
jgi:hypothetical protein